MERIGLAPGTEIGGYRVLGPVGQGGMGAVYRVRDGDGGEVALKLVHPYLTDGPARERLAREVAALQRVRHPGVARVLDAELDQAEAFVVTELVDGQDLAGYVDEHGPFDAAGLVDLGSRLRDALTAVHDAGVLHRDLTPSNVLIGPDGPVLIDFGIAQAAEDARVTTAGHVAGTPGYLSPEVLAGAEPSQAADWWGWNGVLAFAATGRPPFGIRPLAAVLARVRTGDADLEDVDDAVADALRPAFEVDPARRAGPDAVLAALQRAADGGGAVTTVLPPPPPRDEVPGLGAAVVPPTAVLATEPGEPPDAEADATQMVPAPPPPAPPPPVAESDDAATGVPPGPDDEDGWDGDEGWDGSAQEWAEGTGPEQPPEPNPQARTVTVLAAGILLAVAGAAWPAISLIVAAVLAVLVRSVGLDMLALHQRRVRKGSRRGETARAVVGWPWYLLRAVLGVLPAALVAASAVVVVGGVGWWGIGTGRWPIAPLEPGQVSGELPGTQPWVEWALLVLAVTVGLVLIWFGPMSRTTRVGARFALAAVAPPRAGAVIATLLLLAGAGVVATLVVLGQDVVWWPLPGPPDLG
ncbi:serine/threonine protein kinase [Actinotalea sp. M2MS4P-6]|uniref:serine/threonine-protein kinase n=1 Tax=Actinotalea sp. M2MS4P-6 TaxID=2983762 RepID=UPI0021E3FEF6|nr:serine/threonine-protein kinase [Actinotalea sp. M2MS4P-6]MCV2395061.1 serine/threonine protein kinase [Actinotalea sp. M2MS4P-6]